MANSTITATDETFKAEVLDTTGLVLVDFWATWCGPCKMVAPVLEGLAADGVFKVVKVDVDENPDTARDFEVMSIPNMTLFKDGKPVHTVIGARPRAGLLKEFAEYLEE